MFGPFTHPLKTFRFGSSSLRIPLRLHYRDSDGYKTALSTESFTHKRQNDTEVDKNQQKLAANVTMTVEHVFERHF